MLSLTSPVRTRAHDWPAGTKLGALGLATVGLFALNDPVGQGVACGATLALHLAGGGRFARNGLGRLVRLWPFVLLLALWHAVEGTWAAGTVVILRMIAAVGLANLVTMTTRLSDMIDVVTRIARPARRLGVPVRPLAIGLALVVRFTPVLARSGGQLAEAWRARSGRRASWRIVAPLAILALDEAEHVAEALRARGGLIEEEP